MPDLGVCGDCHRYVNLAAHRNANCLGSANESCYVYGCGAPIYDRVWEDRGRRAYCLEHTIEPTRSIADVPPQDKQLPFRDLALAVSRHPIDSATMNDLLSSPEYKDVTYEGFIHAAVMHAYNELHAEESEKEGVG